MQSQPKVHSRGDRCLNAHPSWDATQAHLVHHWQQQQYGVGMAGMVARHCCPLQLDLPSFHSVCGTQDDRLIRLVFVCRKW